MKRLLLATILFAGVGAVIASCLQGIGDRCQVDTDCAGYDDGVVCNSATNTCQNTNGGGIDASVPIDSPLDGPPDARPDAPRDAPSDAVGSGSGSGGLEF